MPEKTDQTTSTIRDNAYAYPTLQRSSSTSDLTLQDNSYKDTTNLNVHPALRRSSTTLNLTSDNSKAFALLGLPTEPTKSGNFRKLSTSMLSLVTLLKRSGDSGDKEKADNNGKTQLHYAAESGQKGLLKKAIYNSGCNIRESVNDKDKSGKTPLHYAAQSGNEECFRLLRREGAQFSDTRPLSKLVIGEKLV